MSRARRRKVSRVTGAARLSATASAHVHTLARTHTGQVCKAPISDNTCAYITTACTKCTHGGCRRRRRRLNDKVHDARLRATRRRGNAFFPLLPPPLLDRRGSRIIDSAERCEIYGSFSGLSDRSSYRSDMAETLCAMLARLSRRAIKSIHIVRASLISRRRVWLCVVRLCALRCAYTERNKRGEFDRCLTARRTRIKRLSAFGPLRS